MTTLLTAVVDRLTKDGVFEPLYVSFDFAPEPIGDYQRGDQLTSKALVASAAASMPDSWLAREGEQRIQTRIAPIVFGDLLTQWAGHTEKPTVLVLDHMDGLVGDAYNHVLRQLRSGYNSCRKWFPRAAILAGVREVRDYRMYDGRGELITGGSGFNIKAESWRLKDFSEAQVRELFGQYTSDTGQAFDEAVYPRIIALTGGHPWLVGTLARDMTDKCKDSGEVIGLEALETAKEAMIQRLDCHVDPIIDTLREPGVRRYFEPTLLSQDWPGDYDMDDLRYVTEIGLIPEDRESRRGSANEMYHDVVPLALTKALRGKLQDLVADDAFRLADGRIDCRKMLEGFFAFYREQGDLLSGTLDYERAAPVLALQAWLLRVVNGSGKVEREYGSFRARVDLCAKCYYEVDGERLEQRFVVESKMVDKHSDAAKLTRIGLEQTAAYADLCNADEAHLVLFDRRPRKAAKRVFVKEAEHGGRAITIWRIRIA